MTRPTRSRSGPSRSIAPDRRGQPRWVLPLLVVAVATGLAVAGRAAVVHRGGAGLVGVLCGCGVAVLAVVGLPSVSLRLVARTMVVFGGALLVRFGSFDGSLVAGSQPILVWVVAAVAVFVLTDRVATGAQPGLLAPDAGSPPGAAPRAGATTATATRRATGPDRTLPAGRADAPSTARTLVLSGAAVVLFAVVLTPLALPHLADTAAPGDGPRLDRTDTSGASLRSADSLDMTQRPELSDEILFTVVSDRATFWRGETFDRWDGRTWTRSEPTRIAVPSTGEVSLLPDDLGASGAESFLQTFRIEADYSDVVFAAPTAVQVDAGRPLAQRSDGTLTTVYSAFGRGATYQVRSRRAALSEARLRAADRRAVPPDITARYAAQPVTSDRVRRAATDVTRGAASTYDKIRALERWMGSRTEYSLDAPLSPAGVDVVDHFLFTSKQGWCEQVASSLVVLARANGIPARLVTGFVPGDRDAVTGTYLVRGREAHAWAEVWFPEVGWVPFDPTADVPLAGRDQTDPTWAEWLVDHALYLLLALALAVAIAGPVRLLVKSGFRRRSRRPVGWPAVADARLVALGARVDRPRLASETAAAYASALAERYADPRLVAVGEAIDDALFAPTAPSPGRIAAADQVLTDLAVADVPVQRPAPVG
ncbi:MAG: Transglutaminase-like enzyme predicted cysteine protease [Acidimicrobiales bacterium]|nr:Transglutaminase-like enzyme predicted cysteine protease [Acidimicrobiales bacterium]